MHQLMASQLAASSGSHEEDSSKLFNEIALLLDAQEQRNLKRQQLREQQQAEDELYLAQFQARIASIVDQQNIKLKDHEVRLDGQDKKLAKIVRTLDNEHFVSLRTAFDWVKRPEQDNHNSVLGQFLGKLCRHYGYRGQFVQEEAYHPIYGVCKKYTVELIVSVLEELKYTIPPELQGISSGNSLVLNKELSWNWNSFLKKFYPDLAHS